MDQSDGRSILLCGSIPFDDAGAVLAAEADVLGPLLRRVPDGETGPRTNWIAWQHDVFARQPAFEPLERPERPYQLRPPFRLKAGADPAGIDFEPLGFAAEALASYALFRDRRSAGDFRTDARFQVSLPTPFAPVYSFTDYTSQEIVYPHYEAAMLAELSRIVEEIPPEDLALQWDVATEMSLFEKVFPAPMDDPDGVLMERLVRLGDAVPGGVELGYHLCYGSMGNRHWKEPEDLGKLVWVANGLAKSVKRQIDWIHMPVPVDRDDAAYFAPLAALDLDPVTELYLGLLHLADGIEGAARRAKRASEVLPRFGIAAECGFGRMPAAEARALLALHRQAAEALD